MGVERTTRTEYVHKILCKIYRINSVDEQAHHVKPPGYVWLSGGGPRRRCSLQQILRCSTPSVIAELSRYVCEGGRGSALPC